jgi:hypothetical protein
MFFYFLRHASMIAAHIQSDSDFRKKELLSLTQKNICVKKNTDCVQKFECCFFDTVERACLPTCVQLFF